MCLVKFASHLICQLTSPGLLLFIYVFIHSGIYFFVRQRREGGQGVKACKEESLMFVGNLNPFTLLQDMNINTKNIKRVRKIHEQKERNCAGVNSGLLKAVMLSDC